MATGDITISGVNFTPEDFDKIAGEVTTRIASTSKDPGQYEVATSLQGVTSIPVFQQSGSTFKLVRILISVLKGLDGKNVSLQKNDTHIQWKLGEDGFWTNLIALIDLKGNTGDSIVLKKGSTAIEWKKSGEADTLYKMLIPINDLKGNTGDSIVLRKTTTAIEWKKSSESDTSYKLLIALSELKGEKGDKGEKGNPFIYSDFTPEQLSGLKGPKGDIGPVGITGAVGPTGAKGAIGPIGPAGSQGVQGLQGSKGDKGDKGDKGNNFTIKGYFSTESELERTITSPQEGDTYGVGSGEPYDIYIYDGLRNEWVNNGPLKGTKGDKGDPGIVTSLSPGMFGLRIENGHLILSHNTNDPVPPMQIDNKGHLVYIIL